MMESLNALLIEKELKDNNYKLLCQINVSEEDYIKLIGYTKNKVKVVSTYMPVIPQPDLILSISLVQIAIRNYKEGKYWRCFQNEIGSNVPVANLNYLGQIFEKTISKYGLFQIQREENSSHMYVENIKAHAFVTNYYMHGFFDFSYAFYEKNLLRELSENIEDDLKDLSVFMNSTLSYNEDLVYISDKSNKTSKSYKLLKSTRAVLASNEDCLVYNMFYPVLDLIDKYYYENEIPSFSQNRFEKEFAVWCKKQEEQEKHKRTFSSRNRGAYSHKPYIRMNVEKESSILVIPSQKFRSGECEGNAQVIITINGISEIMSMEIYKSFGIYVSEELEVPIHDIFGDAEIIIKASSEHKIHIGKSDYRIFNDSWQNVAKFCYGRNYLLVKKDVEVGLKNFNDLKDSTVEYSLWNYYSLNISDDSTVYVGRKQLSIMGEFSQQPIFNDIIENFDVYYKDKKLTYITRNHPCISFVVDRERLFGTTIVVNNNKYFLKNIDEKNIYEWKDDNTKVAVNIKLNKILTSEDGYYKVCLDVPREKNKIICEYFLLKKFDCNLDRKKYILNENGYITIRNGSSILESVTEDWNEIYQDGKIHMFKFPITSDKEYAEFNVKIGEEIYTIKLKLEVFKYGFSLSEMISDKLDYIWYDDLGETLYLTIPGAICVYAYLDDMKKNIYYAEKIKDDIFKMDISEISHIIREESKKRVRFINIYYEEDGFHHIKFPVILRNVNIEPYFKLISINNKLGININVIQGKADLYLDVKNYDTEEIVIEGMKLIRGENIFDELDVHGFYNFIPYMVEADDFGLDIKKTKLKPLIGIGYIDMDNLVNCRLNIKNIICDEEVLILTSEFRYYISIKDKLEKDEYLGYIFRVHIDDGKVNWNMKKTFGRVKVKIYQKYEEIKISVEMFSKNENDWMPLYYDRKRHYILGCDNKLLDTLIDYERFVSLDEDITEYIIDNTKLRRMH